MSTDRVLVLGGTGMLGHKLWQVLSKRYDTHATIRGDPRLYEGGGLSERGRWHGGVDATDLDTVRQVVDRVEPTVIVNAIGVVKQLAAAQDPVYAIQVNALFPHLLSRLAADRGAYLVHFSTDCVFSGQRGDYTEDDIPDPVDLYGRSKLLGEVTAPNCLTLRTSIIGREIATSHGLIEWFLSQKGGHVSGFARAIFTGWPTIILADVVSKLIERPNRLEGLYHLGSYPIDKYTLLCLVRDACQLDVEMERSEAFFCDRSLRSDRFREETGLLPPSWPALVDAFVRDPTPYEIWREAPWSSRARES